MYKIFSGDKCILITDKDIPDHEGNKRVVVFSSADSLRKQYKQFSYTSKYTYLVITGNEEEIWKSFCSLFTYVEAAGGVVKNNKDELLMIYRNKRWDLPKGKIEKGESPEIASLREVEEECGVGKLMLGKYITNTFHIFFQNNKEQLKCTYWFEMICNDSSPPTPQAEEGIEEAKWMNKEEVKGVLNKIFPSLREVLHFSEMKRV